MKFYHYFVRGRRTKYISADMFRRCYRTLHGKQVTPVVASGGFGRIEFGFLRHPSLLVVMKKGHPQSTASIDPNFITYQEGKILAAMQGSPYVPKLYGVHSDKGIDMLVQEALVIPQSFFTAAAQSAETLWDRETSRPMIVGTFKPASLNNLFPLPLHQEHRRAPKTPCYLPFLNSLGTTQQERSLYAIQFCRQLAEILSEAHSMSLLHLDCRYCCF